MSQVNANSYYDANGASNAVLYGVAAPANSMGFRNRIINGDMVIDQRNNGASVTINSSNTFAYCPDRFQTNQGGSGVVFSSQQVSDAPTGFVNSLRVTVSTAATPSAGQFVFCRQIIEGFNIADLGWGTASAQTVTASFWVKSSITGAYAVFFVNSAEDRSYFSTVTVNSANTWEFKTVTVPGDTTGTWLTNNSNGIRFGVDLGSGSNYQGTVNAWQSGWRQRSAGTVNFCQNTGATFQITGVQLEAGSVASPFERIDYGRQLIQCQRYALVLGGEATNASISTWAPAITSTAAVYMSVVLPVKMRAVPSVATSGAFRMDDGYAGSQSVTGVAINTDSANSYVVALTVTVASGLTAGRVYQLQTNGSTASRLTLSSEL
jgi:hypothetical protein